MVIIQTRFLYGTFFISNDELESLEDKDDNTNAATNGKKYQNYFVVIVNKNNNANSNNDYTDNFVKELVRNGNDIKSGYLYKVLGLKSSSDDYDTKGSLRTPPSTLEFQLANAKDITEYIRLKNGWVKSNHLSNDENVIKSPVKNPYQHLELGCDKGIKGTTTKPFTKDPVSDDVCDKDNEDPIELTRRQEQTLLSNRNKIQNQRSRNSKPLLRNKLVNKTYRNGKTHVKLNGPGYAKRPKKRPDKIKYKKTLERREKEKNDKLAAERKAVVDKILEYLESNLLSTRYIYYELKRIEKTHEIRDKLRKMVWIMERPFYRENKLDENVLKCYTNHLIKEDKHHSTWTHAPNNLMINIIQDPPNDGVQ